MKRKYLLSFLQFLFVIQIGWVELVYGQDILQIA